MFDADGNHIGNFNSTWVKQQDGTWRVLFDGPGSAPAPIAENSLPLSEGDIDGFAAAVEDFLRELA